MVLHRVLTHPKCSCDVFVGLPFNESANNLQFAFRQSELVISGSCSRRAVRTIKHSCKRRITTAIPVRLGAKNFNQFRSHLTAYPEFSGNNSTDAPAHEIGGRLSADDSTRASE